MRDLESASLNLDYFCASRIGGNGRAEVPPGDAELS